MTLPKEGRWLLAHRRRPKRLDDKRTLVAFTEFGGWAQWDQIPYLLGLVQILDVDPQMRYELWSRRSEKTERYERLDRTLYGRRTSLQLAEEPLADYALRVAQWADDTHPEDTDVDLDLARAWSRVLELSGIQARLTQQLGNATANLDEASARAVSLGAPIAAVAQALGQSRQSAHRNYSRHRQIRKA